MASDFRLEFNDGWEEDLGRQIRREFQEAFDVVFRDYQGRRSLLSRTHSHVSSSVAAPR